MGRCSETQDVYVPIPVDVPVTYSDPALGAPSVCTPPAEHLVREPSAQPMALPHENTSVCNDQTDVCVMDAEARAGTISAGIGAAVIGAWIGTGT